MNILMISYNTIGHGTYLRVEELARELVKLGQQVTIMATSQGTRSNIEEFEADGINIVGFPSLFSNGPRHGWDPYSIILRINWVKSHDFDIVHGFESRPTVIYPALLLKGRGVPLVLDWCDWFGKGGSVEERPKSLFKFFYRPFETFHENYFRTKPDFTTVICSTLYQRAIDLGVKPKKISVIPNGLNIPGWEIIHKSDARRRLGFNTRDFVIGYVGSLFPKDAILMNVAFEIISHQIKNAKLLHLSRSNYLAEENNLNIITTGNIDFEKLQIGLAACDICWLPFSDIPANKGRFPMKFSNYLSAGKPVISTNVGDVPKYIENYQVGVVSNANAQALSQTTIQLANDPIALRSYAINAYRLSQNRMHSWRALAKRLFYNYEEVLKRQIKRENI